MTGVKLVLGAGWSAWRIPGSGGGRGRRAGRASGRRRRSRHEGEEPTPAGREGRRTGDTSRRRGGSILVPRRRAGSSAGPAARLERGADSGPTCAANRSVLGRARRRRPPHQIEAVEAQVADEPREAPRPSAPPGRAASPVTSPSVTVPLRLAIRTMSPGSRPARARRRRSRPGAAGRPPAAAAGGSGSSRRPPGPQGAASAGRTRRSRCPSGAPGRDRRAPPGAGSTRRGSGSPLARPHAADDLDRLGERVDRLPGERRGAPHASIASQNAPAPRPAPRPPLSRSSDAADLASTAGWRSGRFATSGKRRTRSVLPARNDSSVHVSRKRRWYGWSWIPTRSSPRRSASRTCSISAPGRRPRAPGRRRGRRRDGNLPRAPRAACGTPSTWSGAVARRVGGADRQAVARRAQRARRAARRGATLVAPRRAWSRMRPGTRTKRPRLARRRTAIVTVARSETV